MRAYCHRCFATLPDGPVCVHCGWHTRSADRRYHWNQNPQIQRIETWIKLCSALIALVGVTGLIAMPMSGPKAGYALAIPIGFHVAVSTTASSLTRHKPYFRLDLLWQSVFVFLFAFLLLQRSYWAAPALAASIACRILSKAAMDWKAHLMHGPLPPPAAQARRT